MLYTDKTIARLCVEIRETINLTAAHWPIFATASAAGEMEPIGMHGTLDDVCDRLNLVLAPYAISVATVPRNDDEPGEESHLLVMHCESSGDVIMVGRWVPCTSQSPAVVLETLREPTVNTVLALINDEIRPGVHCVAAEVAA